MGGSRVGGADSKSLEDKCDVELIMKEDLFNRITLQQRKTQELKGFYIFKKQEQVNGATTERYFYLTKEECSAQETQAELKAQKTATFDKEVYQEALESKGLYWVNYNEYRRALHHKAITVVPQFNAYEIGTSAVVAGGGWQMACALTAQAAASSQNINIGTQLGFPAAAALICGALRGGFEYYNLKKIHGNVDKVTRERIIKENAVYAAKIATAMGAWELGKFIGNLFIGIGSSTPVTFWIPVALAMSAGLIQGISAVAVQCLDEQRKYGKVTSSWGTLTVILLQGFLDGAIWQLCSMIPFGSSLARTILKPIAAVVGTALLGLATTVCSYIVNKTPEWWSGMSKDNKKDETQPSSIKPK